jgi:hypothetical protein
LFIKIAYEYLSLRDKKFAILLIKKLGYD